MNINFPKEKEVATLYYGCSFVLSGNIVRSESEGLMKSNVFRICNEELNDGTISC
jgi:hypothetical protein